MKACSVALAAHIAQGQTTLTTLLKVTRKPDGQVFGFTEHDVDIIFSGLTYLSTSSYVPSNLNEKLNAEASTVEVSGAFDSVITEADARARLWDDADLQFIRINWMVPTDGGIILATGNFGQFNIEGFGFKVQIRGLSYRLQDMGGEICGPECRVDFGSPKCAPGGVLANSVTINSLLQTGTVISTDGVKTIVFSGLTNTNKPNGGNLTFLTGGNTHLSGQIKDINFGTHTITLQPGALLLTAIAPGDTFSFFPACDFRFVTCVGTYGNGINFQAEPHVPDPDASLAYPDYVAPHP
jgi:uncharacterized phage protein (TIGR02218 family)